MTISTITRMCGEPMTDMMRPSGPSLIIGLHLSVGTRSHTLPIMTELKSS